MKDRFIRWLLAHFDIYLTAESAARKYQEAEHRANSWKKEAESAAKLMKQVRDELAEQKTQNLLLSDRLESAIADKTHLWNLVITSLDSERHSLRMQVNEVWRRQYGTTPYPEAPAPPDNASRNPNSRPEPFGRGMAPVSEMVAKRTAKVLQDIIGPHAEGA